MTAPASASPARAHEPDPQCVICDGLGVRHTQPKRVGMFVQRDPCPCTILGPLTLPDCQPRTPIDPVTTIRADGLQKGNTDLNPTAWKPVEYRDCDRCEGRGVTGRALVGGGSVACPKCLGVGRLAR